MKKICAKCGKDFETNGPRKYCSDDCSTLKTAENSKLRQKKLYQQLAKLNKKEKKCEECGVVFFTNTSVKKYCSIKCAAIVTHKRNRERNAALVDARKEHRQSRAVTKRCAECGELFSTITGKSTFCSSDCYKTYRDELYAARNSEMEGYL
jgi:predicted nucleic acid-binding Zn ribbon protein